MVSRKVIAVAVVLVLLASSIAALSLIQVGSKNDDGKIKVVATFYPLYYFTSQIAGDSASMEMLIPDNVEPHSWGPSASDMISVSNADMFVYNGAGFEPWAGDFIDALPSGTVIVDTSKNVQLTLSDEIEELYVQAEEYLTAGPYASANMVSLSSTSLPSLPGLQMSAKSLPMLKLASMKIKSAPFFLLTKFIGSISPSKMLFFPMSRTVRLS